MEFIIYLVLAFAAFIGVVGFVVGLFSAPTPILAIILIVGLILTQKSINKFTESKVNLFEDEDKNNIENVEVAAANSETNTEPVNPLKSLIYRGSNYNRNTHADKSSVNTTKAQIKYRGATASVNHKNKNKNKIFS